MGYIVRGGEGREGRGGGEVGKRRRGEQGRGEERGPQPDFLATPLYLNTARPAACRPTMHYKLTSRIQPDIVFEIYATCVKILI